MGKQGARKIPTAMSKPARATVVKELEDLFSKVARDGLVSKQDFITIVNGSEPPEGRAVFTDDDRNTMFAEVDANYTETVDEGEVTAKRFPTCYSPSPCR